MFDPQPGFDPFPLSRWEPPFAVYAHCSALACGHAGKLDRARLERRYGPDVLVGDIKRRLRCRQCGGDAVRVVFAWDVYYRPPGSPGADDGRLDR